MKTIKKIFGKIVPALIIFAVTLILLLSCGDNDPEPIKAFGNPDDFITTDISANIPRLEISLNEREVNAFISVTDQNGNPLDNFTIGNYIVRQVIDSDTVLTNARLQESEADDLPLKVSANMDYSGSMSSSAREDMEAALRTFVALKNPDDQISIVKFATRVEKVQDFTTDNNLLLTAIDSTVRVGSNTAFYSACQLGLDDLRIVQTASIPVVIGFTDGFDNRSSLTLDDLIQNSILDGIPIYTIGLDNANTSDLQTLATSTGGRFSFAPSSQDIQQLYTQISNQLNSLYELQWTISGSSGTLVTVVVTVQYTAGHGRFVDTAVSSYVIP